MSTSEANNPNPSTAGASSSAAVGSEEVNTTNSAPTSLSSAEPAFRQNTATLHLHQHQHPPLPPPLTGTYPTSGHPHHPPPAPIDDAGSKASSLDSRYAPIYHPYYPPPPHSTGHYPAALSQAGPYSAAMAQHARHPPPGQGQPPPQPMSVAGSHLSSPRPSYDREDAQQYHRPIPVRAHPNEGDYRSHPPPPPPPPPPPGYAGHPTHPYQAYSKPLSSQSFPPPPVYHYPVYPANRLEDSKARIRGHQPPASSDTYSDVDGREGATSPSQIEMSHRDEVTNMGCTCKKTKCLKLYCQCFAAQLVCGPNCRCLVCFNTTKHEQARKDAMRAILTRNPAAFDTKFSKTKERKSKEQHLVLAHKLGCKCRRSACMKKYCECYAGNVKCSSNCRCVGCKNTPSSNNFGSGKPDASLPLRDGGMGGYELPMSQPGARTGREPWMMNAAQNLAFLKHGSPTVEKATAQLQHETGEVTSMPSLAASSSDTSPEEKVEETSKQPPENEGDQNGSTVNSLLMAAMAMTEFQARNEPKAQSKIDESGAEKGQVSQPVHSERPELRKVFRPSPKRKTVDRAEDHSTISTCTVSHVEECVEQKDSKGSSSTSVQCPDHVRPTNMGSSDLVDIGSPSDPRDLHDPRDLKRTRLGSVRKRILVNEGEDGKASSSSNDLPQGKTSNLETPNQKASGGADILTPVSARCIDFKKIHLSSSSPPTSTKENNNDS